MEVSASNYHCSLWDGILQITKLAQENGSDPLSWAVQVSSSLSSSGVPFPSFELANFLVSYIFWDNNVPIAWKFLEKALVLKIVPSLPLLALLSTRSLYHPFLDFCLFYSLNSIFSALIDPFCLHFGESYYLFYGV